MAREQYKTKIRLLIDDFLLSNRDISVSAKQIYSYICDMQVTVSITTIYRYLERLYTDKKVIKLVSEDSKSVTYQYVENSCKCHCHIHLLCSECKRVEHLDCDEVSSVISHIEKVHGFNTGGEALVISGVCKCCAHSNRG